MQYMVKVSGLCCTWTLSCHPSKSSKWMCVEDPFLQIQSQITLIVSPISLLCRQAGSNFQTSAALYVVAK